MRGVACHYDGQRSIPCIVSVVARSQYNYTKKMSTVCLSLLRSRISARVHGDVAVTPWRGLGRMPYLSLIFNACPLVSRPINNGVSINWSRAGVAGNLWRCQTAGGGAVTPHDWYLHRWIRFAGSHDYVAEECMDSVFSSLIMCGLQS